MSGGYSMGVVCGSLYLLLVFSVVFCVDNSSTVLDESKLLLSAGCYENVEAGMNITCPSGNNELILLRDLLYGKRNGSDPTCSLTNYHDCFETFSAEQVWSYLHQCSGKTDCGPKIVWGQFKGLCSSLGVSDFVFAKYFCFPDAYNLPFAAPRDCVKKEKVYLRYKAEPASTYKCLIESPTSTGLVVRALDVRLQETAQDENGIGACSSDTGKQHKLGIEDKTNPKQFTCQSNRMQFREIYTTPESSILVTLDVIASQVKPESVWIEITAGNVGDEIYVSCDSSHVLTDTSVCLPTTTTSTTTMPTTASTDPETTTTATTPSTTMSSTAQQETQSEVTTGTLVGGATTTGGGGVTDVTTTGVTGSGAFTDAQGGDGDDGVNEGAIAGGIVGGLVLLLLILAICCAIQRRKKTQRKERPDSEVHFTPPAKSFTTTPPPQNMTSPDSSNGLTVYPGDSKAITNSHFINEGYIPVGSEHVTAITDVTPAVFGESPAAISNQMETNIKENVNSRVNEVEPFDFLKGIDTSTEAVHVDPDRVITTDIGNTEVQDDAIFIADTSFGEDEPHIRDESPYRRFGPKHPESAHQPIDMIFATASFDRKSGPSNPESPTLQNRDDEAVEYAAIRKPATQFGDTNIDVGIEPERPTLQHVEIVDDEYARIQKPPTQFAETGEHPYGRIERPLSHVADVDDFDKVDRRIIRVPSERGEVPIPESSAVIEVRKEAELDSVSQTRYSVKKPTKTVINTGTPKHKSTITIKTVDKKPETTIL